MLNPYGSSDLTKGLFVWDYNLSILYNLTYFELSVSSKYVRLYNLSNTLTTKLRCLTSVTHLFLCAIHVCEVII